MVIAVEARIGGTYMIYKIHSNNRHFLWDKLLVCNERIRPDNIAVHIYWLYYRNSNINCCKNLNLIRFYTSFYFVYFIMPLTFSTASKYLDAE